MNIRNPNVTKNSYNLKNAIENHLNHEASYYVSSTGKNILVCLLYRSVSVTEITNALPSHVLPFVSIWAVDTGNQVVSPVSDVTQNHIIVCIRINL